MKFHHDLSWYIMILSKFFYDINIISNLLSESIDNNSLFNLDIIKLYNKDILNNYDSNINIIDFDIIIIDRYTNNLLFLKIF